MSAMIRQKDINFLIPYQKKSSPQQNQTPQKKKNLVLILIPSLMVVAFLGTFLIITVFSMFQKAKTDSLNDYVNSPEIQQAASQAEQAIEQLNQINGWLQQMRDVRGARETYPRFDQPLYDAVEKAAGGAVRVSSYAYDGKNGMLGITMTTGAVGNCPIFVEQLKATGYFTAVSYYGYGSGEENSYSFAVNCLMKAGERSE